MSEIKNEAVESGEEAAPKGKRLPNFSFLASGLAASMIGAFAAKTLAEAGGIAVSNDWTSPYQLLGLCGAFAGLSLLEKGVEIRKRAIAERRSRAPGA